MPSQHRPKTMLTFLQQSDCQLPWRYDLRCVVLCPSKTSTHLLESLEAFAAMTDVPQTPSLWSLRFIVQWLQCVFLRVCLWKNMGKSMESPWSYLSYLKLSSILIEACTISLSSPRRSWKKVSVCSAFKIKVNHVRPCDHGVYHRKTPLTAQSNIASPLASSGMCNYSKLAFEKSCEQVWRCAVLN